MVNKLEDENLTDFLLLWMNSTKLYHVIRIARMQNLIFSFVGNSVAFIDKKSIQKRTACVVNKPRYQVTIPTKHNNQTNNSKFSSKIGFWILNSIGLLHKDIK